MHRSEWEKLDSKLVSKRIMITRSEINGKMLAQLHLRGGFGVNITRVNRAGVDLVASPGWNCRSVTGLRLSERKIV